MNEAFLLWAIDRIVSREEVRHQNTIEMLEKRLGEFAFARFSIDVCDLVKICHHPHTCRLASYAYPSLIHMHHVTVCEVLQDQLLSILVVFRGNLLEPVNAGYGQIEVQQSIHA